MIVGLMKNGLLVASGMALSVASAAAVACSCGKAEIAEALDQATDVVVARLVSATQTPAVEDASGKYVVEYASFDVIETIKGSRRVAEKIQIRSEIGPGPCGRSARNSPMWLEDASSTPSDAPKAVSISDTWLIYGYGREPYELSACSRSLPIELVDKNELERLRQLVRKSDEP